MNAMNVRRHSVKFRPHSTSESSHQGEIIHIPNSKAFSYSLSFIRHQRIYTEKNPLNVMNVGKLLVLNSLIDAFEPMPLRKPETTECGKCLGYFHTLVTLGEFILE